MYRVFILLSFILVLSGKSYGQYIQNFTGYSDSKAQIHLSWNIPSGPNLSGLIVERSLDSTFTTGFSTTIYTYSGLVGPGFAQNFSIVDSTATLHRRNYYRVNVQSTYYSLIIGVNAGERTDNYTLYPTIVSDISKLTFNNPNNDAYVMEIAHTKGYMLYHFEGLTSGTFDINATWFDKTGMYFFRMYKPDGSGLIKGKFAVVRNP
jgi:hypothetical protein